VNLRTKIFISVAFVFLFITIFLSGLKAQVSDNKLDQAYSYLGTGQTDLAISLFEEYTYANPSDTKILLQLGYAYKQQSRISKARDCFNNVIKNSVSSSEINTAKVEIEYLDKSEEASLMNSAYDNLNKGNTTDAIRNFEEILIKYPKATGVYMQLAYIYKQQGNNDKSQRYFQFVVDNATDYESIQSAKNEIDNFNKPKYTAPVYNTYNSGNISVGTGNNGSDDLNEAYTALNSGNKSKAIEIFERYINTHPDDTKIYLQLAYIYDSEKRYSKSLEYFDYVAVNSNNRDEVDKAKQSGIILRQMLAYNSFRSMNIYFYNAFDSYYQNYVSNFLGHINFRMSNYVYYGFYGDVYLDARSNKTNILNDRYLEAGGFMKFNFSNNIVLELRLGYFKELDLDKSGVNFKPILSMGTRFGDSPLYLSRKGTKTENFYFDIYSVELYDSKYKNLFAQLQLKEVLRYMTGGYSYFEFYLTQMAQTDSRQLDYNNYGEVSMGVDFKPNLVNFPAIFIEGTNRINFVGPDGKYFQGDMKSIFQFKAGFIINFNSAL
jgi:Tfp pilus assembly protein PilF